MNKLCTAFMLSILPCLALAQMAATPNENPEKDIQKISSKEETVKQDGGILMYPNPVVHSKFVTITSDKELQKDVLVYNVMGKEILKQQLKNNRLDVTSLNAGIYIMKVVQDGRYIARKLVIR